MRSISLTNLKKAFNFRSNSRRSTRRRMFMDSLEARCMLAADPIPGLSDEFDDSATTSDWQRIHEVEGWGADQLNVYDIDTTQPGRMVQQPHSTVWYQDWRGPLAFKEVTGDFVITTEIHITDRDDVGGSDADDIPSDGQFSLGGIMLRTPRNITNPAVDWAPGSMAEDGTNNGENYVFLSLGYGTGSQQFALEVKTTRNSNSQLELTPLGATANTATVQIARIGDSVITLYRLPGEDWQVHRRFARSDFPETLQVGLVTYSDWGKAGDFDPFVQNSTVLTPGMAGDPTPGEPFNPDLTAGFEYARFVQPDVPVALAGAQLSNPFEVSDNELLSFLGDNANIQETEPQDPDPDPEPEPGSEEHSTRIGVNLSDFVDWDPAWVFKDAFLRARPFVPRALNIDTGESTWQFLVGDGPALQLDDHGWVTELPQWDSADGNTYQQVATTTIFAEGANQPAGIYRAEWDGDGEVVMPFVTETGMTPEGRHYALVNMPGAVTFTVEIHSTDPANPVRNINLWMPDYNGESLVEDWQPGSTTSPFHPLFLDRLDEFDTLRFMQFQRTIDSDIVSWDDRRELDDASQSDGDLADFFHTNGVALEYMIELANSIDVNPWFNMPHEANDEFVTNFATMVRDTLDPDLTIYVEWSNELWNGAFPTYHWLQEQMTLPENAGLDFFQVAGQEIQRDFDIWSSVFAGQEHRIVRVVAGQQANSWLTEQLVLNVNGRVDAISATAYADISFEMSQNYDATTTADDIIDDLLNISIPWASDRLQEHRSLVEQFEAQLGRDLLFVTYEGGSHVMGYPNDFLGSGAEDAAIEALYSPRMYDVYQTLLNEVREADVDLYTEFTFTSRDIANFYGSYGLLHDMTTPLEEAHQLRALLDFAGQTSEPVDDSPLVAVQFVVLDSQGNPVTELEVGQTFTLQALVDDLRPSGEGIFSAYVDVNYDDSLANVAGGLEFGEYYLNANEGSTATAGLIDEAGAVASTDPLGSEPRVLFSVSFVATATGELVFDGDLADLLPDHEMTLYGLDEPVAADRVEFHSAILTIVPAAPPATAVDDAMTIHNDGQPVELDVLANDSEDPSVVESLTIVSVGPVLNGTAMIDASGKHILFTPAAGFYGDTSFEYTLLDAYGQEASATVEVTVHKNWHNSEIPTDVNGDQTTSPMDALVVINALISNGAIPLPDVPPASQAGWHQVDVNGDGHLTPADALVVINELIRKALERFSGEGESASATPLIADTSNQAPATVQLFRPMEIAELEIEPAEYLADPIDTDTPYCDSADAVFCGDDLEDVLIECFTGLSEVI